MDGQRVAVGPKHGVSAEDLSTKRHTIRNRADRVSLVADALVDSVAWTSVMLEPVWPGGVAGRRATSYSGNRALQRCSDW
jgi:hypothetical protein